MAFAQYVYPVPDRFVNVAKEPVPGSIVAATYTFPMTTFKPADKYTRLEDSAWRNSVAHLYNLIGGVRISDVSCGGPLFADGIGYPILDICGDYWQSVSGGVTGTSSSLSGSVAIGATSIVLASGTIPANAVISVGGTGTTAEEVRQVTSNSNGTLTLNAALYQGHAVGGTVISYASYNGIAHNFSFLNNGAGAGGYLNCQPPTYTWTDYTGLPAGSGARNYSFSCFSEVTITGEATGLVMWDGKFTALASQIAGARPATILSTVAPQASWLSTMSLGGQGTANNAEFKLTLTRKLSPKFTNQGTQDPYSIPRGYFDAGLSFNFDPAQDETEFIYYLSNNQPAAQIVASNGLSGTAAASLTISANQVGFTEGEMNDSKDVFGFDLSSKLVANTTNAGPSGGWSPVQIQLINQVISY